MISEKNTQKNKPKFGTLLYEIVSEHPKSKGLSMKVTRYTEKELENFKDRQRPIAPYDTCRIEWTSMHGLQIDVFVKPSELMLLSQLLLNAYVYHVEDTGDWTEVSQ